MLTPFCVYSIRLHEAAIAVERTDESENMWKQGLKSDTFHI